MNDDDNRFRGSRRYRDSRPSGPGRRSRAWGGLDGGLFERILQDVVSLFEDERDRARRSARDGRVFDEPFDEGANEATRTARDGAPAREGAPTPKRARRHDRDVGPGGYDDEDGRRPGSMRGRGPKNYHRSDARLTELVGDALHDDHALDASGIEVSVSDGDVTLSGRVASRRDKHRAENLAARAAGADDVDNRLRVRRGEGTAEKASTRAAAGAAAEASGDARTGDSRRESPGGLPGESARDEDDYGHP